MSKPTAPNYAYDQGPPPPPQYETDSINRGQMSYGTTTVISYPTPQPNQNTTQVIIVGGCPACRIGVLEDDYTALGVICAILFFPLGILCCLALKQRRCSNCGAIFG